MKTSKSFMQGNLARWALTMVMGMLIASACHADEATVEVDITIATYLDVEFVSPSIGMNPVNADEFYISNPLQQEIHAGSSLINVRTNVTSSMRTRQNIVLTHQSGAPTVPVTAQIQFFGLNFAYSRLFGGELYWVLNYPPGMHIGMSSIVVSVQQEWTAEHTAGVYTGTVLIELLEGIL
jgi:hypothetical protein